jgi:hypothetical protein
MKRLALSVIVGLLLIGDYALADEPACENSPLVKGNCFMVSGTLYTYDGWPPFLRIESEDKKLYGVGPVESELIPPNIRQLLPTQIEGQFELCPFGETTSVPYDKRKIHMVCIKAVRNAWYYDRETSERTKLK